MKNYTFLKVLSAVLCIAMALSFAACMNTPELDTSGRTVIYAPSFDGTNDAPTTDSGNVMPSVGDTTQTAPAADTVYSFLAAGDNIIHEAIYTDAHKRAENGMGYNFLPMYDGVADMISGADIAFVNQEGPIAGASYGISGKAVTVIPIPEKATKITITFGDNVATMAEILVIQGSVDNVTQSDTSDLTELNEQRQVSLDIVAGTFDYVVFNAYGSSYSQTNASAAGTASTVRFD